MATNAQKETRGIGVAVKEARDVAIFSPNSETRLAALGVLEIPAKESRHPKAMAAIRSVIRRGMDDVSLAGQTMLRRLA